MSLNDKSIASDARARPSADGRSRENSTATIAVSPTFKDTPGTCRILCDEPESFAAGDDDAMSIADSASSRGYKLPLVLITPQMFGQKRYRSTRRKVELGTATIRMGQCSSKDRLHARRLSEGIPEGWDEYTHSEGVRYLHNRYRRKIAVLFADVGDEAKLITEIADYIDFVIGTDGFDMPNNSDFVFAIDRNDFDPEHADELVAHYYIADYDSATVCWMQDILEEDADYFGFEPVVAGSERQIHLILQHQMAFHMQFFPHNPLSRRMEDRIVSAIVYSAYDVRACNNSTSPLKLEQWKDYMAILQWSKGDGCDDGVELERTRTWILGRMWEEITHSRIINFHGEDVPRLERTQILIHQTRHLSWWTTAVDLLLLFNVPHNYRVEVNNVYADKITYAHAWQKFLKRLLSQWEHTSFFATVFLTVNVGFLAIVAPVFQAQDNTSLIVQHYSSSISALCSIASALTGLILMRKHRTWDEDEGNAARIGIYMERYAKNGTDTLAKMYSLPHALLMWAALTFCPALIAYSITLHPVGDIPLAIVLVILSVAIVSPAFLFWSVDDDAHAEVASVDSLRWVEDWRANLWKETLGKVVSSVTGTSRSNTLADNTMTAVSNYEMDAMSLGSGRPQHRRKWSVFSWTSSAGVESPPLSPTTLVDGDIQHDIAKFSLSKRLTRRVMDVGASDTVSSAFPESGGGSGEMLPRFSRQSTSLSAEDAARLSADVVEGPRAAIETPRRSLLRPKRRATNGTKPIAEMRSLEEGILAAAAATKAFDCG